MKSLGIATSRRVPKASWNTRRRDIVPLPEGDLKPFKPPHRNAHSLKPLVDDDPPVRGRPDCQLKSRIRVMDHHDSLQRKNSRAMWRAWIGAMDLIWVYHPHRPSIPYPCHGSPWAVYSDEKSRTLRRLTSTPSNAEVGMQGTPTRLSRMPTRQSRTRVLKGT